MQARPGPISGLFRAVLRSRKSGRSWLVAGVTLVALAVLIPNSEFPLLTLCALIGATASSYLAPGRSAVILLTVVALLATLLVWLTPPYIGATGIQWLAAGVVLILATGGIVHYVRGLEERAFEFGWQAELSAEAAELGVFRWDFESDLVQANEQVRTLFGLPLTGPIFGEDVFQRIVEQDRARVLEEIEAAQAHGGAYRSEFRVASEGRRLRWVAGRGQILIDRRTGARSLAGINYDVTEAKENESLISRLIDGIGALFCITSPEGRILELNSFGAAISGLPETEWKGAAFADMRLWGSSEETRAGVKKLIERARSEGQVSGEAPYWSDDGEKGWVLITVTPISSYVGEPLYICICAVDTTQRHNAEEGNRLLVQELNHRIRNLFSVTNALISLSARHATSIESFAEATRDRLRALHEAHNIGASDLRNRGADLRDIVETTIRPWRADPQRIFVEGGPLTLDAGVATAWALIIHELASSSAKFGSLREPSGRLYIDWRSDGDEFEFEWREEQAAFDAEMAAQGFGFGAEIIEKLVAGYLSGDIDSDTGPHGRRVRIRC